MSARMDAAFRFDPELLDAAMQALGAGGAAGPAFAFPDSLPETGLGDAATLAAVAPALIGAATGLGAPDAFAHMDPPTPTLTWAIALWNAALNQNLLHPALSPAASAAEARLMAWLAPGFGMTGGHMTGGSTLSNITALWAAREIRGVRRVVRSEAAHVSIPKAANLLGLVDVAVPIGADGVIDASHLPDDLADAALVLTAGTTAAGLIEPLALAGAAAWTHVDAAWAGPLRFSARYRDRLDGIDRADSVAISAHKWLFQPKDAALVLFRDVDVANGALGFGGSYLAAPNIGLAGSRGAAAWPLLATLLSWGRAGLAARIDGLMAAVDRVEAALRARADCQVHAPNASGVLLWRPRNADADAVAGRLAPRTASTATVDGRRWVRHVAANPGVNSDLVLSRIREALREG